MKRRVADLNGALLDAVVARATGIDVKRIGFYETPNGPDPVADVLGRWDEDQMNWVHWNPSTDWRDGGPIIERERIVCWPATRYSDDDYNELPEPAVGWNAIHPESKGLGYYSHGTVDVADYDGMFGASPLIAAMRAFVQSKFGEEVELP